MGLRELQRGLPKCEQWRGPDSDGTVQYLVKLAPVAGMVRFPEGV